MRNISCSHTKEQVRNRTKTVTRRLGWKFLKPGTLLRVVEKAMGLEPGERIVPMAVVRVTNVTRERVWEVGHSKHPKDVAAEGFPENTVAEFVQFFCRTFKVHHDDFVTRIEWVYESRCLSCGFEISKDSSFCGECTCEEEGA